MNSDLLFLSESGILRRITPMITIRMICFFSAVSRFFDRLLTVLRKYTS
jgi:hypothetical protein